MKRNLIGFAGTSSADSTNRMLLRFMHRHFADQADIELVEVNHLPMFDKPADTTLPAEVAALARKIEEADGVIISTPEYDHAVPASLINALDWLSYGVFPFIDKPVMITGASYGTLGSSRAQAHLRQILDSPLLRARIMPSSEFLLGNSLQAFDTSNNLLSEDQLVKLDNLFADFLILINDAQLQPNVHSVHLSEAVAFAEKFRQQPEGDAR